MNIRMKAVFILLVLFLFNSSFASAAVRTPEDFLGYGVGADRMLAKWETITAYFRHVDGESDRVTVREIGKTSQGRTMILAEVSAPETVASLGKYREIQRKIADPRLIRDAEEEKRLAADGKTVVFVNCSIHASEIAATQMSMELLYDLATSDTPEVREILAGTIVLIAPSANPDGHDMVTDWYNRSLGKPWEGSGMPWLYHPYAGHDNNRDWFMLNLPETRNLSKVIYKEWFPQIAYDIHQMGSDGPRYFVPPFFDPRDPNIPPLTDHMLLVTGGHMAAALTAAGKRGVINGAMYDNWWHGGFRSAAYRHNMIGILTEAASVRIASPIFLDKSDLKGGIRGLATYTMTANFPDPWPGGWWRLRDIVDYEKISCMSLFTLGARYRELILVNAVRTARRAVERGAEEPPFAWLVPPGQRDPGTAAEMLRILMETGIEVHRADEAFKADGVPYPAGTYILLCSQPYRPHLNDMMEPQKYPDRERYPGGPPETPYDIAAWTLPLQMGVKRVAVTARFECRMTKLESIARPGTTIKGSGGDYIVMAGANDDFRLLNRLAKAGASFSVVARGSAVKDGSGAPVPAGSFHVSGGSAAKDVARLAEGLSCTVARTGSPGVEARGSLTEVRPPRVALYQSWTANPDEGWTRLVLEQFEFPYTSLHNPEIRAGGLRSRYDCIVLPSASAGSMINGQAEDSTEPEFVGGIGSEGVIALQRFVEEGGTLVCIDEACGLPVQYFNIPVKNALAGKKSEDFYCPGSLLRVRLEPGCALGYGLPEWVSGYFARSQAFDVTPSGAKKDSTDAAPGRSIRTEVAARYADALVLESGWMRGESNIAGKPAIVRVSYGRGKIDLIGFRVQYRAQPHGTYRLLFNSIWMSGAK